MGSCYEDDYETLTPCDTQHCEHCYVLDCRCDCHRARAERRAKRLAELAAQSARPEGATTKETTR